MARAEVVMAEPVAVTFIEDAWKWLAAVFVGTLAWMVRRVVGKLDRRLDVLEEHTVTRREYDGTIAALRRDHEAMKGEIRSSSDKQEKLLREYTDRADARGERIHRRLDELAKTMLEHWDRKQ